MAKFWEHCVRNSLRVLLLGGALGLIQEGFSQAAYAETQAKVEKSHLTTLNINDATAAEFETLQGIGAVIANRIVTYRDQYGPFEAVDELQNIPGIGAVKLEKMKRFVTV